MKAQLDIFVSFADSEQEILFRREVELPFFPVAGTEFMDEVLAEIRVERSYWHLETATAWADFETISFDEAPLDGIAAMMGAGWTIFDLCGRFDLKESIRERFGIDAPVIVCRAEAAQ